MADERNIADQTEQELVLAILKIYSGDEKACLRISQHVAEKLTQRRKIIRDRRAAKESGNQHREITNQAPKPGKGE